MPDRFGLKKNKIKGLLIITDLIASGKQVNDLIKYLLSDPSIRSYISFNLIQDITILSHLCTQSGKENIISRKIYSKKWKIKILYARHARTVDSFFIDKNEKEEIIDLCRRYAQKKELYLGFGNIGLMSVYEHRIPNNVPAIFIQNKNKWIPLFENRRVNEDLGAESIRLPESNPLIKKVLFIAKKTRRNLPERISEQLRINMIQAQEITFTLQIAGYLTERNSITSLGNKLLAKTENIPKSYKKIDKQLKEKYYPYYKGHKS